MKNYLIGYTMRWRGVDVSSSIIIQSETFPTEEFLINEFRKKDIAEFDYRVSIIAISEVPDGWRK